MVRLRDGPTRSYPGPAPFYAVLFALVSPAPSTFRLATSQHSTAILLGFDVLTILVVSGVRTGLGAAARGASGFGRVFIDEPDREGETHGQAVLWGWIHPSGSAVSRHDGGHDRHA